jgi:hypothetical protein
MRDAFLAKIDGMVAFREGRRTDTNPHKRGTEEYRAWRDGWTNAALWEVVVGCETPQGEQR